MRWRVGDRVLLCGKHAGTIVDFFEHRGRVTYSVKFDDAYFARIPPQTAIGVREEDLAAMAEAAGAVSSHRPPSAG